MSNLRTNSNSGKHTSYQNLIHPWVTGNSSQQNCCFVLVFVCLFVRSTSWGLFWMLIHKNTTLVKQVWNCDLQLGIWGEGKNLRLTSSGQHGFKPWWQNVRDWKGPRETQQKFPEKILDKDLLYQMVFNGAEYFVLTIMYTSPSFFFHIPWVALRTF